MPKQSFERRAFLKLLSAGLGASFCSFPKFAQAFSPTPNIGHLYFALGKPQWFLHNDGTFDIYAGNIRLSNCRPSIDGQSIFARNTFMGDSPKGKRIIYEVENGFVMLDLRTNANTISIGAELSGMKYAPAWFNPLGEGYLTGASHFFMQGMGTGSPTGIFDIKQSTGANHSKYPEDQAWSFDSFMVTGLIAENGDTLAIGAYEQTDFIQRSSIFNQPRQKGMDNSRSGKEAVFFESGFATENIPLNNEFIKFPDLFIYQGNQPYGTMQNLAWSISEQNQARRDTDSNYFWSPFQDFRTSFSYQYLLEQLKMLDKMDPAIALETIEIGPGYCITGDWLDTTDDWPKTMEEPARQIFQRLYRAGIYVAPFAVHEKSKTFRNHPHWILKNTEGIPIAMDEDAEGKIYALDGSHEDVKKYIGKVFKTFRKMGYTYFELDCLEWGLKDESEVQRAKKGKSSVRVFREVMEIIREEIGAGAFITANRAPFSPLIGLVDAVRIDRNQSWKWDKEITGHILQESYNTQYFNNVFWQNDPDVVLLRNYKNGFTDLEQKSLALWNGFMGGAVGISDNFKTMESDKLQLWRFIEPPKRPRSAILPFWGSKVINKVAVRKIRKENAWMLLILNDTDKTVSETYSVYDLIGKKEAWVFYWEPGFSLGLGKSGRISAILGSHESKVYYLSEEKDPPPLNMCLGGKETTNN